MNKSDSNQNSSSMSAIGLNVAFEVAKHDALNEVCESHNRQRFLGYSIVDIN